MTKEEIIKASREEIQAQTKEMDKILADYLSGSITPFELANKMQACASSIVRELISIGEATHR